LDINQLLRGGPCSCGKTHTCRIQSVFVAQNAIEHLEKICCDYRNILLVADQNTFDAAGEKTVAALREKHLEKVIFSAEKVLVPNEAAIRKVCNHLEGADCIVGIGSGVIQDLCTYVSFYRSVPYVIIATAPSMDGYASNGAAMMIGGMKVTYSAGLPIAILADTEVIRRAPMEMIKAGYGDIIGKFSALNDWKLSHLVNGEYFCPYIYDMTYAQIQKALSLSDGILKRNEESIRALMEALIIIGILMSFAGSSRPASGSEHHLSHFFEVTGILNGTPYFPHGIDVAYSTVITAKLRKKILSHPFPSEIYRPSAENYTKIMKRIYQSAAEGCIALQKKSGNYSVERSYLQKEDGIRRILEEMPTEEELVRMLSAVELETEDFYRLYGKETIENAILYAKDLKDRYTVLWLYYDFFGGDSYVQ